MKIQKIQALCKSAKRIMIINDSKLGIQWLSDGTAIYPLFKLPRLSEENIFAMFDIPADKQGKIYYDERDRLPETLDFGDTAEGEQLVNLEPFGITAYGRGLEVFRGSEGAMLVDKKYLAPFDDSVAYYERVRRGGRPYIVAKEGMFISGIILPFEARHELSKWLSNTGEAMITVSDDEPMQSQLQFEDDEEEDDE